jgi:hypothetical protein
VKDKRQSDSDDLQVHSGVDRRPSKLVLHDSGERDLNKVPPERREESDNGEEEEVLDRPCLGLNSRVDRVQASLVPKKDEEERDANDDRCERLSLGPEKVDEERALQSKRCRQTETWTSTRLTIR